jgi:hypothetical protein
MADGKFAITGFRVFGKAEGNQPETVSGFKIARHVDTRDATFTWKAVNGAYAYNIYYGVQPDKLYNCIMVHDKTERYFRGLNKGITYYAQIEAIGETGLSQKSEIIKF